MKFSDFLAPEHPDGSQVVFSARWLFGCPMESLDLYIRHSNTWHDRGDVCGGGDGIDDDDDDGDDNDDDDDDSGDYDD